MCVHLLLIQPAGVGGPGQCDLSMCVPLIGTVFSLWIWHWYLGYRKNTKPVKAAPSVQKCCLWQKRKWSDDNCVCRCVFRVSECTECKMPVQSLAKVFGPTIVGYSSVEAEPMKMFAETAKQAKVSLVKQHCIDAVVNFYTEASICHD